ncbi:MAG: hypothetical protein N2448_05265 [Caloramator sp.]|nr:hypothetical protein [Caloramator sp.]
MQNLTEKDKKLLLILMIFIIGVGYYYIYGFMSGKISKLKEENQRLINREEELNRAVEIYNKNRNKIEETKYDYFDISQKLSKNLDEKFCIVDALNLLRKYGAQVNDIPISQRQEYKYNKNNKKIDGGFYYTLKISTQISYDNLKKLFIETKQFNTIYSIDNISMVPTVKGNILAVSFDLNFYGFKDENAPIRQWQDFNLKTGKDFLFSKLNFTKKVTEEVTDNYILKNKDFIITASTLNSPTSAVEMVKSGENVIVYGKNKQIEKAQIEIKQNKDTLLYKMSTEGDKYPRDNTYKEFKANTDSIIISIYSSGRKYIEDKNIVLLNIKNESDKKVRVYVLNDDKNFPRLNITTNGNKVYVEKR